MVDKKESKPELEREYIINVRKKTMLVPTYQKANKAVKSIKEFLAKHMKVENRDTRLVKMDRYLNQEMWFRGRRHPITKIKVKAKKIDGIVYVELAEVPKIVQYQIDRDKKQFDKSEKEAENKTPKEALEEKSEAEKVEEKEKEDATVEAGFKENKLEAKNEKHTVKNKQATQTRVRRQVMQK